MKKNFFIFIFFLLNGCESPPPTHQCPELYDEIYRWLPYPGLKNVTFILNGDSSVVFSAADFDIYHIKSYPVLMPCECGDHATLYAALNQDADSMKIQLDMTENACVRRMLVDMHLYGMPYTFVYYPSYLVNCGPDNPLEIGDKLYAKTITADMTGPEGNTGKLIFARNYGLILIEIDGKQWILDQDKPDPDWPSAKIEEGPC